MESHDIDSYNIHKWNRLIQINYWVILLAYVIATTASLFFHTGDSLEFIFRYILYPSLLLLFIIVLAEAISRVVTPQVNSLFIIFWGGSIAATITNFHPTVNGIQSVLVIPIISSIIYFRKDRVLMACCTSLTFYFLLITFNDYFNEHTRPAEIITTITVIIFGGLISNRIIVRGEELIEHLQKSIKSSQDLMVSKIMIEKMAKTDVLTDLNNHRAFQEYSEDLLQHAQGISLHLAVIDIDNFKLVNDTFGHQTGDIILKYTAQAIKDRLSEHDFVARYGGEEFVVIFTEMSLADASQRIENIRQYIHQTKHKELNNQNITISIGLHSYTDNMSKDNWFSGADQALYQAKQTGKNKATIHQEEIKK
jgi:diguanylate cyclase (GGDEF)-like protein